MKQLFLLPAAAVVAALLGGVPGAPPAPAPGLATLERASRLLLDERASDADRQAGLLALLDAVTQGAPLSGVAGDWPAKVARARDLLAGGAPPDGPPGVLLREAYRAANRGVPIRFLATTKPEDVVALVRKRMDEAAGALRRSEAAKAVPLLLEAALLVVTPVER